jgi:4-hydroxyphenylacetate 3-monooxygenase
VIDEDHDGITIKGGKMLATSAMAANELMISNIQPLREGDEPYAFTAVVPMNAKGLKLLSRRSYEQHAISQFDFPLAWRFDENDAVVYFDEVKIPWERIFLLRNIAGANAQWHATRAHVYQNYQGIVRLAVKLKFLLGIARKIAETNGIIGFPQVRETLGELASKATMIDAMVAGMEAAGETYNGYFVPNRPMLCAAQAIAQKTYPQIVDTLRDLSGGGLIMVPSSFEDFHNPEINSIIQETQKSPVATSLERVKLFKLAWDAVGSEFGSRHLQYEKFYSGSSIVLNGHNFNYFDWQGATAMVDGFMGSYDMPEKPVPDAAERKA